MPQQKNSPSPSDTPSTPVTSQPSLLRLETAHLYRNSAGAQGVEAKTLSTHATDIARAHATLAAGSRDGLDSEYACLTLHQHITSGLSAIENHAARIRRFRDVVVVGIGGSSLGAIAVSQALPARRDSRVHFVENVDPDHLYSLLADLDPVSTALIAISKSGGTIETVTQYLVLRDWLQKVVGKQTARERQWIITDPNQGWLHELAQREGIPTLPVPPKVGGRYSVLTAVGLLPLAVMGVDVRALLAGANANAERCVSAAVEQNPALEIAALSYLLDIQHQKRVSVFMPYAHPLRAFGDWYCQLWAESLGKPKTDGGTAGTLPVRALGTVDQHSQLQLYLSSVRDKVFTFLTLDRWAHTMPIPLAAAERTAFPYLSGKSLHDVLDAEFEATRSVLTEYGHPNLTIRVPALTAHAIGQLIDLYQRATVYAGLLYGINPLDQPAVEQGKQLTLALLRGRAS